VTRLKQFIRARASEADLDNAFVVDGFLHAIPLPDGFADVLITSHTLGWNLEDELQKFERVVKRGGFVIHCPGTVENAAEQGPHECLVSLDWRYVFARYQAPDNWKRKYWKQL
jgi:ubiquinone/menaquinone biosynthesis C-methylase UbiE